MYILKRVVTAILLAILVFCTFVATRPSEYLISRSIRINALPGKIFPLINNQHNWGEWSPWAKEDPDMKASFGGPNEGKGSVYKWSGNMKVGIGTSTIVESKQNREVRLRLDFKKPMKSTADVVFTLEPDGNGTMVTWGMNGTGSFMQKAMGIIFNCEKIIGEKHENGLENIRSIAEKITN